MRNINFVVEECKNFMTQRKCIWKIKNQKTYIIKKYYHDYKMAHKLIGYHQRWMENIFSPIKKAIQNQSQIHLYRLFKENGEHCQISFLYGKWLIASKNVTLLAWDTDDLQNYNKERYIWAKLIARQWIQITSHLEKDKIEELTLFLSEHTIIGEYCGNKDYQHITQYENIDIIFYAIVKNNSKEICLPVSQAIEMFNSFGLKFVKQESMLGITSFDQVVQVLDEWLTKVGTSAMNIEGEGSVVYIVAEKDKVQSVISLCKLKTIEYLIFRKMREQLKILATKLNENEEFVADIILRRFYKEIKLITDSYMPPEPLNHYLHLARFAFKYIHDKKIPFLQIRYQFVDLLRELQNEQKLTGYKDLEFDESLVNNEVKNIRHTRIILLTLPLLLDDDKLKEIRNICQLNVIESQFIVRANVPSTSQKSLSVIYLIPKMPYNINDQNQLEEYIKNSQHCLKEPMNICFVFYGLKKQNIANVISKLSDDQYLKQNPEAVGQGVQFTTVKPKDREQTISMWVNKANKYYEDIQKKFPDRVYRQDEEVGVVQLIDTIYKQFGNFMVEQLQEQEKQEIDVSDDDDDDDEDQTEEQQITMPNQLTVGIIYPILIPGAGKSTFLRFLQEKFKDYPFYYISADDITKGLMNKAQRNEGEFIGKQFERVQKFIKDAFLQNLYNTLEQIIKSGQRHSILYLDRNSVPNTLLSTIAHLKVIQAELQQKNNMTLQIKNIGLLFPEQQGLTMIENNPLSIEYVMTILMRLLERQDHPTLGDDQIYKVKVLMKNVTIFNDFKFNQTVMKKLCLNDVVRVPQIIDLVRFDNSDTEQTYQKMKKVSSYYSLIYFQCLKSSVISKELGEGEEYQELVDWYYRMKEKYQHSPTSQEKIMESCNESMKTLELSIQKCFQSQ